MWMPSRKWHCVAVGLLLTATASAQEGRPHGDDGTAERRTGFIPDSLRLGAVLGAAGQRDTARGGSGGWGLPFQPSLSVAVTDRDEIFVKLGFAAGDGVFREEARRLGRMAFEERVVLGLFGLIDATDYIDDNAFSNDEYTQFMNEALVNAPNAFVPSYEVGAAVEWDWSWFGARALHMRVAENEEGRGFGFSTAFFFFWVVDW